MSQEEFLDMVWTIAYRQFRKSINRSFGDQVRAEWWERFEAAWRAPIIAWMTRFPPVTKEE